MPLLYGIREIRVLPFATWTLHRGCVQKTQIFWMLKQMFVQLTFCV